MIFCLLVIVLSILSFGHCVVYPSVFWSLCCLSFCLLVIVLSILLSFCLCVVYPYFFAHPKDRIDNTMTKWQKDRQHNDQKTEGYITQWPTDRRIHNTMTTLCCLSLCLLVIVLSILLSFCLCVVYPYFFAHCVVYPCVFWSLCCLSFCHYNDQKTEGYITQWPTDRRIHNTMTNRQKDRQHNDQKTEG
jgi:hypothetical protein